MERIKTMKKRVYWLILPLILAACTFQTMPPQATQTPSATESPVTNGIALFEEDKLAVGNTIGSFTVTKMERDENGKLISAEFEGDMTVSCEILDDAEENMNGEYTADEHGMTGNNQRIVRCTRTAREGLPKTARDNTDDFSLLVTLAQPETFCEDSETVTLRLTKLTYRAAQTPHYAACDAHCVQESTPTP